MLMPAIVTGDFPDRRRRPRLRLAYPVRLCRQGESARIETRTENLSCEGFFCITDRIFFPHESLECELLIPGEELGRPFHNDMILRCQAEVVRVVPQEDNTAFGVAFRLADYTIGRQVVEEELREYSTV